jgi:hypothetical protein
VRLRRLSITILATTLLAAGIAAAQETGDSPPDEPPAGNPLAGVTLSCSFAAPSWVAGCWVERPVAVLGPVELAIGVDVQGDLDALAAGDASGSHVAPYGILAYYGAAASLWAEVRLPELGGLTGLGSPDWLRVGFTYRLE